MHEETIQQIEAAVAASRSWAETGWPASFGNRQVAVNSLKEAEALSRKEACRLEAVNYWKQVKLTGEDTAAAGGKALEALRRGDECAAADALYFCQYVEKPIADSSKTWAPLYEAFCSTVCA